MKCQGLYSLLNKIHEMSKPVFWGKWENLFQNIVYWSFYPGCRALTVQTALICRSSHSCALRKHAYSNILKILQPKTEIFFYKNFRYFSYFCSIDCGYSLEPPRRGGSNEYPQSMFLSRNKENKVYPCKPQFYYIKVGFKGVNII